MTDPISDERLAEMLKSYGRAPATYRDAIAALSELQQRRASVVTEEMVERVFQAAIPFTAGTAYRELRAAITAALSVVSHETASGETQTALPATDETQGVKREPVAWHWKSKGGMEAHTFDKPKQLDGMTLTPLFSLSQLEAVERERDAALDHDWVAAPLYALRVEECRQYRARAEAAEASLAAMREALTDIKDATRSFRDESGDEVAGQVILRVDGALSAGAPS